MRRSRNKTFTRMADANAYDAKIKLAKRKGEFAGFDAGKQSLRDFCDEWLRLYAEPNLAKTTLRAYRRYLKNDILPALGHVSLRNLTAHKIQEFAAGLKAAGRGDASTRKMLVLLQGILQRAVEWERLPVNPVRAVRKPPSKKASVTDAPSPQRIEQLRSSLGQRRDKTLVSLIAYAGLRPGEALALRWGDVRERSVLVSKSVSLGEEKDTKTAKERSVPLMKPVIQDLNEWKLASGRPADDELVFAASTGAHWQDHDYRNWRKRVFKPAARPLGIARPYDLRHSYASLRFAERANPAEIADEMGHSLEVLFNTYAHVIAELKGVGPVSAEALILEVRNGHILVTSPENTTATTGSSK
jgi:integrase